MQPGAGAQAGCSDCLGHEGSARRDWAFSDGREKLTLGTLATRPSDARRYIHGEHAVLGPRLDRVAERLCEAARASEADEVLVLGHSLSAARRFVATRSSRASGYTRRKHLRLRSSVMPL